MSNELAIDDPEALEAACVAAANRLAMQQLLDGTAPPSIVAHYLKIGSERNQLEIEKLKRENELLASKTEALESSRRSEELYEEAIAAMRRYSGADDLGGLDPDQIILFGEQNGY